MKWARVYIAMIKVLVKAQANKTMASKYDFLIKGISSNYMPLPPHSAYSHALSPTSFSP